MSSLRTFAVVALAIAVPFAVSCTVVFAPRDDVQRCENTDDCDDTGDPRYVAVCQYGEESFDESKVDQVCVAAFSVPGCKPPPDGAGVGAYGINHDLAIKPAHYAPDAEGRSCASLGGVVGCPPDPMTAECNEGLTRNENGICDDGSGTVFSASGNEKFRGQDVRDQYCRSFFCDDSFVCDTSDYRCVPCDPAKPFAEGGCGELYIAGAPSCFYTDPEETCKAPDGKLDEPTFGSCN